MKAFAIWFVGVAASFGVLSVATDALTTTTRVVVAVDSSFPMTEVWRQVPGTLDRLDDRERAEFTLVTEKSAVHSWQLELALGAVDAYAPCDFDEIESHPEIADADELILITTDASCDPGSLSSDWEIITLNP